MEESLQVNWPTANTDNMHFVTSRTSVEYVQIIDDDDEWVSEALAEVDRRSAEVTTANNMGIMSPNNFQTPERCSNQALVGSSSKYGSSSSSGEPVQYQYERRIIKPPACKRSPFIDYNEKKPYQCKPETNRLYSSVILHARLSEEESGEEDLSPKVIDYNGYFVSVRELACSMKKEGFLLSHVVEVGIQYIMQTLPPESKKVVMPLRFAVMFPVLENLDTTILKTTNHYWIFNVNLRDRRFEILDSWRTLQNKSLDECARKIAAAVRCLWDKHYPKSHIQMDIFKLINIDVPKQVTEFDCGVYALTFANYWEARIVPKIKPDDVQNIRRQMTSNWVRSVHNKAPWQNILKLT